MRLLVLKMPGWQGRGVVRYHEFTDPIKYEIYLPTSLLEKGLIKKTKLPKANFPQLL